MARVTKKENRRKKGSGKKAGKAGKVAKNKIEVSLPTKKSVPSNELGSYTWLIYGERKIGKTSLASQFEDPFFLMFEPGGRGLALNQKPVPTWRHFLGYIDLLEKNPGFCQTLVIDTGYMCYERCHEYCVEELELEDIRDDGWGNGWKFIEKTFRNAHARLENLGIGLIVIAHSEIKEVQERKGMKYDKLTVQLGKQAFKYYAGAQDNIVYYQYDKENGRELTIKGDDFVEAGTRCKGHFFYTDGTSIKNISMGDSEEEGYRNLEKAFKNQLEKKGEEPKKSLKCRKRKSSKR